MFRRQFVQWMAAFGTGSVATLATAEAKETRMITYRVKGFSCITCAIGLDTVLQKQKGIAWSKSGYPDGIVSIRYDPRAVSEKSLKGFIEEMGFTATEEQKS
jgi:copper chaperone CopZ